MSVATVTSSPSLYGFQPYITTAEYRQAPTGVTTANLVPTNPSATEAELFNGIMRASSWVDVICGQSLGARVDTYSQELTLGRDGMLRAYPRFSPIQAVTAFSYGTQPNNYTALSDLSQIVIDAREFTVPTLSGNWSSAGPLQFSPAPRVGGRMRVLYTYVPGFTNTTLAATATAGATSISVKDGTGAVPALTQLNIYDGAQSEVVTVASTYVFGSATLPLVAPLQYPHSQAGIAVSALPHSVKLATILLTSTIIQTRGAVALIAPTVSGLAGRYTQSGSTRSKGNSTPVDANVELACTLLADFARNV